MTIKRVKLSDASKKTGKSQKKLLQEMSDEEIERRANLDPDNPILTEEQMREFKIPGKKEDKNEKS